MQTERNKTKLKQAEPCRPVPYHNKKQLQWICLWLKVRSLINLTSQSIKLYSTNLKTALSTHDRTQDLSEWFSPIFSILSSPSRVLRLSWDLRQAWWSGKLLDIPERSVFSGIQWKGEAWLRRIKTVITRAFQQAYESLTRSQMWTRDQVSSCSDRLCHYWAKIKQHWHRNTAKTYLWSRRLFEEAPRESWVIY